MSDDPGRQLQDEVFGRMERALPRVAPPPDLLDRIVREVEDPVATPVQPTPLRRSRPSWRVAVPALAAVAAAIVVIALVVSTSGGEDPALRVAVTGEQGAVSGSLALFDPGDRTAHVVVTLSGLERAPAGHHYTAWILRAGSEQMTPIGSFDSTGSTTELSLPLPGAGDYAAFDVSLQDDAAPPEHSGISVAGATLS